MKAGKIEATKSKAEIEAEKAAAGGKSKKKKRDRTGPSAFYYEDDNAINLDYPTI